jgi:hypothetical protein
MVTFVNIENPHEVRPTTQTVISADFPDVPACIEAAKHARGLLPDHTSDLPPGDMMRLYFVCVPNVPIK